MGKNKQGSWSIPTFQDSGIIGFSNPYGQSTFTPGTTGKNPGTFGFQFNQPTQDYYNQLTNARNSIYAGLGYNTPATDAGIQEWQNTFTNEALRNALPQYSNAMFARGLGGSAAYGQGLADLLSNVNTQGVLNANNLYNNDQMLKLNYLASINPEIGNLLNVASVTGGNSYNSTQSQYNNLFPYLATYNQPKQSGLWGAISGALQGGASGAAMGGPLGALAGAGLGGATGYFNSYQPASSTPLATLQMAPTASSNSGWGGLSLDQLATLGKGFGNMFNLGGGSSPVSLGGSDVMPNYGPLTYKG